MRKTIDLRIMRLTPILLMLFACLTLVCSCKKDYNKLATEFERQLPESCEVVYEQINDVDHYVYYKDKSDTLLTRHNLDDMTEETIKPKLDKEQHVCGIYLGKNNIAFLVNDGEDYDSYITWYSFWFYNLKTLKFKNIEGSFEDAFANEAAKTFTGYMEFARGKSKVKYVYDFDGKPISEEEVGPTTVEKNWQCPYCGTVVTSTTMPEETLCPNRYTEDQWGGITQRRHVWQCLGEVE